MITILAILAGPVIFIVSGWWMLKRTEKSILKTLDELSQREKVLEDVLKDFAKDEPRLMDRLRIAGLL